jgi:mannose/cellobiose epimerase-like protein (N-acyl-D-glucosamine 2-epimerase family)
MCQTKETKIMANRTTRETITRLPFVAGLVLSAVVLAGCTVGPAGSDYRSRMQSVNAAAAFDVPGKPDVSLLPTGQEWLTHIRQDLLPYWTTPVALGNPVGNFPTFRANDGSVIDPQILPQEVRDIDKGETWLLNRMGRQYTRTMSRQIYAYCVAYHMTGEEKYLQYAKEGIDYICTKMVDKDGIFYTWTENGVPGPENAKQRISQDLAYALMGPAMYYYLTRDQAVLQVLLKTEKYIFDNYTEGNGLRWINEKFVDMEETHLPTQKELVSQLDQINGYLLLTTTVLEGNDKGQWLKDMVMLANTMKNDYYDADLNQFWGRIDGPEYKKLGLPHVDFGHTIKTLWMMLEIGLRFDAPDLRDFARVNMPRVFREAYSRDYGTWIEKKLEGGKLGTDRIWWLHDELDQAAATLSMGDLSFVRYLVPTYRYWFFEFVDQKSKDVWHGLTGEAGKPGKPMLLKAHLWKNAFHDFEHALVGYITCQAVRGEPVRLYYAFESKPADDMIQPYLFAGKIGKVDQAGQKVLGNLKKVVLDFREIKP